MANDIGPTYNTFKSAVESSLGHTETGPAQELERYKEERKIAVALSQMGFGDSNPPSPNSASRRRRNNRNQQGAAVCQTGQEGSTKPFTLVRCTGLTQLDEKTQGQTTLEEKSTWTAPSSQLKQQETTWEEDQQLGAVTRSAAQRRYRSLRRRNQRHALSSHKAGNLKAAGSESLGLLRKNRNQQHGTNWTTACTGREKQAQEGRKDNMRTAGPWRDVAAPEREAGPLNVALDGHLQRSELGQLDKANRPSQRSIQREFEKIVATIRSFAPNSSAVAATGSLSIPDAGGPSSPVRTEEDGEDQAILKRLADQATQAGNFGSHMPEGPAEPPEPGTTIKSTGGWLIGNHAEGDSNKQQELDKLVHSKEVAFSRGLHDLPGYKTAPGEYPGAFVIAPHNTKMPELGRIGQAPRRQSEMQKAACMEKLTPLVEAGIIERSTNTDAVTNLVVVPKKNEQGTWSDSRVAVDYRKINELTPTDRFVIPLPEDLFQSVGNSRWYSKIDLRQGFLQIPIPKELQHYTAFWWNNEVWQYTRCPYGLKNSPAHFQRVMNQAILGSGLNNCAKCYIDDILVHSVTYEDHLRDVAAVLEMISSNGLRAHPEKSVFGCSILEYIGHDISCYGITPNEAKVAAIRALPEPTNVEMLRRALGFANYYRTYVPAFSEIAQPLNQLLCKDVRWEWTTDRAAAWHKLKEELCKPGNALRRADPERQYILHTDWSKRGLSAVLGQMGDNGSEYLVACSSRSNNQHEAQYGSYRGEMMAAVWGIRTFKQYLHGTKHPFILYTDHKALVWLMKATDLEGQYARWACLIGDFDFTVVYRPGKDHTLADVPSRNPLATTKDLTGAREEVPQSRYLLINPELEEETPSASLAAIMGAEDLQALSNYITSRQETQPQHKAVSWSIGEEAQSEERQEVEHQHVTTREALIEYEMAFRATSGPMDDYDFSREDQYVCAMSLQTPEPAGMAEHQEALQRFATSLVESLQPNLTADRDLDWKEGEHREKTPTRRATGGDHQSWKEGNHNATQHQDSGEREGGSWRERDKHKTPTNQNSSQPMAMKKDLSQGQRHRDPQTNRFTRIDSRELQPVELQANLEGRITVFEPFGGMASGLEMVLRNGLTVSRYIYCDNDAAATLVARHRLEALTAQFPNQLTREAWKDAFTSTPQDVFQIKRRDLISAGALGHAQQWIIVGGFECQDLSSAGSGKGFEGTRSISFFPLLNVIGELQDLQRHQPPIYIVENTAMLEGKPPSPAIRQAYKEICEALGKPVLVDAARFGSHAHRLRNYWTNLVAPATLQQALDKAQRDPTISIRDILPQELETQSCIKTHGAPWYVVNRIGESTRVLPTLVATVNSYAFRNGGAGMLVNRKTRELVDVPIETRELAMGYQEGATAAPGVTFQERHKVIGSAFDANAMQCLWAIATAITRTSPVRLRGNAATLRSGKNKEQETTASRTEELEMGGEELQLLKEELLATNLQAQVQESAYKNPEIWQDVNTIAFLQHQLMPPGVKGAERDRIRHRAAYYQWDNQGLIRRMMDGTLRRVPKPEERRELVTKIHVQHGHFGQRRTTQLVMLHHWWTGLYKDCAKVVKECEACNRVSATFNSTQPVLKPLPVRGLMYRWGLDLFGPYPESERGYKYVLVCVEHFSKWIEAFPMTCKASAEVAYHLLHGVIARYGAPAQMVTDGGGEFAGEVEELLRKCLVDHRITSAQHPQANGLAERAVGTLKRCLKRHVAETKDVKHWDEFLPWILMGYRATLQASTKFSPYHLLYSVAPGIASEARELLEEPLDFDNEELAERSILERAKKLEENAHAAGQNLHIAQKRDELRYAKTRSGAYVPQVLHFKAGDYVYTKNLAGSTGSTPKAREEILRVKEVRGSGVLILEGADGVTTSENAINCSPCHLPIKRNPTVEARLRAKARPTIDLPCQICCLPDRAATMLLCDGCQKGYHMECLKPALTKIPKGYWWCSNCLLTGVDKAFPPEEESEPTEEKGVYLEVEKLLRHRKSQTREGEFEYKIRWKGYKAKDDTWEPASNVTPDLLDEYHSRPKVQATMVAAATKIIMPDITEEEARSLGSKGLTDIKSTGDFKWISHQQAKTVLNKLLPGTWSMAEASQLGHRCPGGCRFDYKTGVLERITQEASKTLEKELDYSKLASIITMHAPAEGQPRARKGTELVQNWRRKVIGVGNVNINRNWIKDEWDQEQELQLDVTLPGTFSHLRKDFAPQMMVIAPKEELADIILPLAVRTARRITCCLISKEWSRQEKGPRADWLFNLRRYCNMQAIPVVDDNGKENTMVWLIIDSLATETKS